MGRRRRELSSHETHRVWRRTGTGASSSPRARPAAPCCCSRGAVALIQARFPDLAAAARQLPQALVADGELVVWDMGALSFEALQRRASAGRRDVPRLAESMPAHFIAFDVPQLDGRELFSRPCRERRALLEALFTEHSLAPPWALCPVSGDVEEAHPWMSTWTQVPGVEGVVAKGLEQRYEQGRRGW
ncbi:hypothetical protein ACQEVS_00060 [Streptomyces sp. CA-181903]|uniref:ATP-dependent DNA ligase n=1 Tax=Streptomyces sp. CA-181903 TaxID=3240055 RepID=UPI003D8ABE07